MTKPSAVDPIIVEAWKNKVLRPTVSLKTFNIRAQDVMVSIKGVVIRPTKRVRFK